MMPNHIDGIERLICPCCGVEDKGGTEGLGCVSNGDTWIRTCPTCNENYRVILSIIFFTNRVMP